MRIPSALGAGHEEDAAALVREYLGARVAGPVYTGAAFETIGAAWDAPGSTYSVTPADLVALTTLSVDVPARAAIDLLGRQAEAISGLLARIDPRTHLVDAGDDLLIDRGSPGNHLWFLLRSHRGRTGLGPAAVTKLMARKRPNLFPIHDTHHASGAELSWTTTRAFWRDVREALKAGDRALWNRLLAVQELAAAGQPDSSPGPAGAVSPAGSLSPLRILDIVVWMEARTGAGTRRPAPLAAALPRQRDQPVEQPVEAPAEVTATLI